MKNSKIEKFINENTYQYLELGLGKSRESIEELRKLLTLICEENIFQIEETLYSSGSPKTKVLTAKLCAKYASDVLNKKSLSELIFSIGIGLENSHRYVLDL